MNYRPNIYYATWWIKSKDNAFKRHFFRDYRYMRGILGRDSYLHKKYEMKYGKMWRNTVRRSALLNINYGKTSI